MKMMEVRCCCRPQKLLGYLPVADGATAYHHKIAESVRTPEFKFAKYTPESVIEFKTIVIHLPVDTFIDADGSRHYALKSEETPIEILRRLPGFVEYLGKWSDQQNEADL